MNEREKASYIIERKCLAKKCANALIPDFSCNVYSDTEVVSRFQRHNSRGCSTFSRFENDLEKRTISGGTLTATGIYVRRWERPVLNTTPTIRSNE